MAKITIPQVALDSNQQLETLAINAVTKGSSVKASGDNVIYGVSSSKLPIQAALLVHSVGGKVEEFEVYIEIANKDDNVPTGMKGATDDDGNTLSWEEWLPSNFTFYEADERIFVPAWAHSPTKSLGDVLAVSDDLVSLGDLPVNSEERG